MKSILKSLFIGILAFFCIVCADGILNFKTVSEKLAENTIPDISRNYIISSLSENTESSSDKESPVLFVNDNQSNISLASNVQKYQKRFTLIITKLIYSFLSQENTNDFQPVHHFFKTGRILLLQAHILRI